MDARIKGLRPEGMPVSGGTEAARLATGAQAHGRSADRTARTGPALTGRLGQSASPWRAVDLAYCERAATCVPDRELEAGQ